MSLKIVSNQNSSCSVQKCKHFLSLTRSFLNLTLNKMISTLILITIATLLAAMTRKSKQRHTTTRVAEKSNAVTIPGCVQEPRWDIPFVTRSKFSFRPKLHFCTYGDTMFEKTMYRLCLQAEETRWFDRITAYKKSMLSPSFSTEFKELLDQPRGGGYWIWKVDILL